MVTASKGLLYRSFGLIIGSDLPLPELTAALDPASPIDVDIRSDERGGTYRATATGSRLYAAPNVVMFQVPETAAFRVEEGARIRYTPAPGAPYDRIRLYLLGTCMAVVLLQRKILPLHGSAIKVGGDAYAIVGDSGAGKSTLASALLRLGCELLTDDIAAVCRDASGAFIVQPSYPQQKLWLDSLGRLGMSAERLRPLFDRETKFSVPAAERFSGDPTRLRGVFELTQSDRDDYAIRELDGLDKVKLLYRNTFRYQLIEPLQLTSWHFEQTVRLAERISAARIERPVTRFTAEAVAQHIMDRILREET